MKLRTPFLLCISLIALAVVAASAKAQGGLSAALPKSEKVRNFLPDFLGLRIAAADFDNDQKPDGAVLQDGEFFDGLRVFRIRLYVSAGQDRDLTFQSNETSLTISALDVNHDGMPDLVVEQIFTHRRLQIWLNDGRGRFRPARVEDFPSMGDAPCAWSAPLVQASLPILAMPSRSEKDQGACLFRILQFNSSSSHWLVRPLRAQDQANFLSLHSPRGPPNSLPLI